MNQAELSLIDHLLHAYDPGIRPVINNSHVINVTVHAALYKIMALVSTQKVYDY